VSLERRLAAAEREVARRYPPRIDPATHARALLAEKPGLPGRAGGWGVEATALVGAALGIAPQAVHGTLAALANAVAESEGLTTPRDAMRAALTHLDHWSTLDDAARRAAVADERWERITRDAVRVCAAVDRHGLPVAAPDLDRLFARSRGFRESYLRMFAEDGLLRDTGERREGWPVYDRPTAPPASAELERAPPAGRPSSCR
jgi:hypothetical protein